MNGATTGHPDLAGIAAAIERLAGGLSLAEEPGSFVVALEQGAQPDAAPGAAGRAASSSTTGTDRVPTAPPKSPEGTRP
jgi:hypothetical protein